MSNGLYQIIYFCIKNNINYNLLLNKNFIAFIAQCLKMGKVNNKIKINSRTFKGYIQILDKYGLIIINSKKPLRAKLLYNPLLHNLLIYFGYENLKINNIEQDYTDDIKKELSLYKKLRKNNEIAFKKIIEDFEVSFVYHSLSLEGNPITLPDTIKILKDKIIPADLRSQDVDELKNYQIAIAKMIKDSQSGKNLSLDYVLEYHRLAMSHRMNMVGKIRNVEVFIRNNSKFKLSRSKDILFELNKLFNEYNQFIKKKVGLKEVIDFASYFHNQFQHIHPFVDGNSRITRLITFHLLNSKDIPILDIPFGLLDDYLNKTKASSKRNDQDYEKSLSRIILFNLKKINEKLNFS